MRLIVAALVLAAGIAGAAWLRGHGAGRYVLVNMAAANHAFRLDTKTGQVCHVTLGADAQHLFVVGCTTHVMEEDL